MKQISAEKIELLPVKVAPLVFSKSTITHKVPLGISCSEIVKRICPWPGVAVVVRVDGEVIAQKDWAALVPTASNDVQVRVVPQKGGGGKNPLSTILSIAVMIAAPYLSAAILGPGIIASTAAGAALISRGLSAVIGIAGKLLVNALAPPPKPTNAGLRSRNGAAESPTQFIEGATNLLPTLDTVIPIALGVNRMFPFKAARDYTETFNNDQFVRQLFTTGWGEEQEFESIKIGETDITEYTDYEIVYRADGDLHETTSLYTNDVFQNDYSVLLEASASPTVRTTQADVDEAIIDITFPRGLFGYNSNGKKISRSVTVTVRYSPTGAGTWTSADSFVVSAAQQEALRRSLRLVFPSNGTYDIEVDRTTADSSSDQIFDQVYLTSIKSVTHTAPVVLEGLNGLAIRIKGTAQLNGPLDQLNFIVKQKVLDYDNTASPPVWTRRVTSNPASLYRYALQCPANAKALADERIIITDLEEWHTYCEERGYTYNRIIDYDASLDDILRDIAAAGAASPDIVDGKRTVVVDREKDVITQIITPRNSWQFTGELIYPVLPHAWRVRFRNSDKGYQQDERIVYRDGYNEFGTGGNQAATEFEVLEYQSCDNADLAYKHGRRHFADAELRPENFTLMMWASHIEFRRGDRTVLEHDVPLVGVGDGRIKTVETSGGSPNLVTGFTIDDTVTIPSDTTYFVRIVLDDGTQLYKEIETTIGNMSEFQFVTPFPVADTPAPGNLCGFWEAGGELDVVVTRIESSDDLTARVTFQEYAQPGIANSETGDIPAWESKVTVPLAFVRPAPPALLNEQSDEAAMQINSDGSLTTRAIFTLDNPNDGNDIYVAVAIRETNMDQFRNATLLEAGPERVVITGLQDGTRYDIHIRYGRAGGVQLSAPLEINNYLFIGAGGVPDDIAVMTGTVTGLTGLLKWDKAQDIDFSHYELRYSPLTDGATWETSTLLEEFCYENRLTVAYAPGTYFVKTIDLSGNESANAAEFITTDPGFTQNLAKLIDETDQSPLFPGTKDNVQLDVDGLVLIDESAVGYYYLSEIIDQLGVFTSFVRSSIQANGAQVDEMDTNNVFTMTDVFGVEDVFGLTANSWAVTLEYQDTLLDPNGSPAGWDGVWKTFLTGNSEYWGKKFRLKFESFETNITPKVTFLQIRAEMPDRIERGKDLSVTGSGVTITYDPAFKDDPALTILIKNQESDDKIEFSAKDAGGFTFKVYNVTAAGYVTRTYDYIASSFGRDNT